MKLADPSPLFFGPDDADPFVRAAMTQSGASAAVVVPIVAHDRFYGILSVTVVDRPERLRSTPALRDRLAGVVATGRDRARQRAAARADGPPGAPRQPHRPARPPRVPRGAGRRCSTRRATCRSRSRRSTSTTSRRSTTRTAIPSATRRCGCVSDALRRVVRDDDAVFRVGGEEFAVLLPGLRAADAAPVAERLRAAVAGAPFQVPVRVSVGLASWPAEASDASALLERADAALYAAKRGGKDRVALASSAEPHRAPIGSPRLSDGTEQRNAYDIGAVAPTGWRRRTAAQRARRGGGRPRRRSVGSDVGEREPEAGARRRARAASRRPAGSSRPRAAPRSTARARRPTRRSVTQTCWPPVGTVHVASSPRWRSSASSSRSRRSR